MPSGDRTRGLLRWLEANESFKRIVVACPAANVVGLGRRDLVVRLPSCVTHEDTGVIAQLSAVMDGGVEIAEHLEGPVVDHLLDVFISARMFVPGKRSLFSSPMEVELDAVPLARRTVLGLSPVTALPLDPRDEEEHREFEAFRLLGEKGQLGSARVPGRALELKFDGCIACGVCTKACPEGALEMFHDPGQSTLVYNASACQGDLACVRLCPEKAIEVGGELSWQDLIWSGPQVVATVPTATCERCQVRHHEANEQYCFGCRSRVTAGYGTVVDIEELKERTQAHRRLLR